MSESSDYQPAPWAVSSHTTFAAARAVYGRDVVAAGPSRAAASGAAKDQVPAVLTTQASRPVIIVTDGTGSMGEWAALIFGKLPYLVHEAKQYCGPDVEVCFACIGDYDSDNLPLQVRPFDRDEGLVTQMKELNPEGGGGGGLSESYALAALWLARNCQMPNAKGKGICIFIGDEAPKAVKVREAGTYGIHLQQDMPYDEAFAELKRVCDTYCILLPYSRGQVTSRESQQMARIWQPLVGEANLARLEDPDRVVDTVFGFLGRATDKEGYFRAELMSRQRPDQVDTVLRALYPGVPPKTLLALPAPADGNSVTRGVSPAARKVEPLI